MSLYAKENGCIIEDDPERDTKVVDMDALEEALEGLAETDIPLVIDGHYSHELLVERATLVILLRKAPWELIEVLQNRLYSYDKVWENLEAEIIGVIAREALDEYPIEKLLEVDTTGKTPEESIEEIMQVIRGEKAPSIEPIDWVTHPETLRVLVNRTCTLS